MAVEENIYITNRSDGSKPRKKYFIEVSPGVWLSEFEAKINLDRTFKNPRDPGAIEAQVGHICATQLRCLHLYYHA